MGLNGCDFRFGVDGDHLAALAITKLQGELVKDGREPSVESKGKREKSFSKKAARGKNSGFLVYF